MLNPIEVFEKLRKYALCHGTMRQRHAACIGLGNTIMSYAVNVEKTHPIQADYASRTGKKEHVFLHAEIASLIKAGMPADKRRDANLFVVRVGRNGKLKQSRPCEVCQLALRESGIQMVYYSGENGEVVGYSPQAS